MSSDLNSRRYTVYQVSAPVTLVAVEIWGFAVLWYNSTLMEEAQARYLQQAK